MTDSRKASWVLSAHELFDLIASTNALQAKRDPNGWRVQMMGQSGSLAWTHPEHPAHVFATPGWDNDDCLCIETHEEDGKIRDCVEIANDGRPLTAETYLDLIRERLDYELKWAAELRAR